MKKKTVQYLKMEIIALKKTEIGNPVDGKSRKRTGTTDSRITYRIQEMEERISGVKETTKK